MLRKLVVLVFAVLPFLGPSPAAAASTGTLFAITGTGQALVKIDPMTGAFTQVANLNNANQPQSTALASDPRDHRLFALRTTVTGFDQFGFPIFTTELLTFDSQTGAQVFNPAPTFPGFVPNALVFDTSTSTLFGLTFNQIVKIDPATAALTAVAPIPGPGVFINSIAIDSSSHTIYLAEEDVSGPVGTNTTTVFAINDGTGSVSPGVLLDQPVRQIAIDGGKLLGISDLTLTTNFNLVSINNSTGATTFIAGVGDNSTIVQFGMAVDPATHSVFINIGHNDPITFAFISQLLVIDDQTGAPTTLPFADGVAPLGFAFETPVLITPESIKQDVSSALASGAITKQGVAQTLLGDLNAAAAARGRGQCNTAGNIYQSFINDVNAQAGKSIATSTATQLINEAQFLISNCP